MTPPHTPAVAYPPPKPMPGLELDETDFDTTERLLSEVIISQREGSEALRTTAEELRALGAAIKSSTDESTKAREAMGRIVAIGEEHRKLADERRAEERAEKAAERAEVRAEKGQAMELATRAATGLWATLKPAMGFFVMAWATFLAAQHFGIVGGQVVAQATTSTPAAGSTEVSGER